MFKQYVQKLIEHYLKHLLSIHFSNGKINVKPGKIMLNVGTILFWTEMKASF